MAEGSRAGNPDIKFHNYRKFRKNMIDETSDDAEDFFSMVYEKCGDIFNGPYEAIFPVGIDVTQVSNQSVVLQFPGFGNIQTTVGELIRKIIVAGEEKMEESYVEAVNRISVERSELEKRSQAHTEGTVQNKS